MRASTSTLIVAALAASPAFAAPVRGPASLSRRQSQEDVDAVAKSLIDIIFSGNQARGLDARQGPAFLGIRPPAVEQAIVDRLNSALGARDLDARQSSVGAVGAGLQQVIDSFKEKFNIFGRELDTRQSQEDVDAVAKSLIDIIFSGNQARALDARQSSVAAVGAGLQQVIDSFTEKFNIFGRELATRQSQEDVDAVAKSLIDILFSGNQARELNERKFNLGTAANVAGLASAGLGIGNVIGGLFQRQLTQSDLDRELADVAGNDGPINLSQLLGLPESVLPLGARQSQEDVDEVAESLINILFSGNQARSLGARQSQEDVDAVAKSLIDILFAKRTSVNDLD